MAGLSPGQVLVERYRLERRIAIGGMGEVWRSADTRLDRPVAVKVLRPELSENAEFRRRFHAEAQMTASLNHPGIAAVHDYGETVSEADRWSFIVMELVTGEPLAETLSRRTRLSTEATLDILVQAGEALQAAHERGLVHRDIKPGNILITPSGVVKLTDFGIARAIDSAPMTSNGMVMGTAHYIAPEQAAGNVAGPAGDVYSLGVVGYECLAGQRPFPGDNALSVAMMHISKTPPPLPSEVPPGARTLIEAALAKDPRQRYRTGGEFAAAASAVRAGRRPPPVTRSKPLAPTALLPRPPTAPPPHSSRQGRRVALALLGSLALVLGGYLARDAMRPPDAPASAPAGTIPAGDLGTRAPSPGSLTPDPAQEVFIVSADYQGRRGDDAASTATVNGLVPSLVDDDGDPIDSDRLHRCRVVDVNPSGGYVPRGSTLELTCRRGR